MCERVIGTWNDVSTTVAAEMGTSRLRREKKFKNVHASMVFPLCCVTLTALAQYLLHMARASWCTTYTLYHSSECLKRASFVYENDRSISETHLSRGRMSEITILRVFRVMYPWIISE